MLARRLVKTRQNLNRCQRIARVRLVDLAGNGDGSLTEDVGNLRFLQARSVVLEGKMFFRFVEVEAPQAVGIGKLTQQAKLNGGERGLQFVSNFDEGHGE